jgi:signal transduction histidine kinase
VSSLSAPHRRPAPAPAWSWWELVPALPVLAVGLLGTGQAAEQQDWARPVDGWAYALVVVSALALLLRRRAPVAGLAVCGLAMTAYLAARYPFGPILLSGPVAAYAVASRLPWRSAVAWIAGFVVISGATPAIRSPAESSLNHLVWACAWAAVVGGTAAIGAALQVRRRSEAGVRAEQARRAVSEERLQMAQDVHDGVGHGLAVIAMHAGVALHVLDRDPARARELLGSIQTTSREALDGLRADLDRFRSADEVAVRRPVPVLQDLPVLLARMRDGGLVLHEQVDACLDVPGDVATAAYRIVQESLTNVLRHAGDTPAWVRVTCSEEAVAVEVRDRGAGSSAADVSTGSGIAGMHRRAAAVGGRLTAGPAPGGGFLVHAELPLRAPLTAEATRNGGTA